MDSVHQDGVAEHIGGQQPPILEPLNRQIADFFTATEFLRLNRESRPQVAAMIRRLQSDPGTDPWSLLITVGQLAAERPCGVVHGPHEPEE
jgi:hypothetical protein